MMKKGGKRRDTSLNINSRTNRPIAEIRVQPPAEHFLEQLFFVVERPQGEHRVRAFTAQAFEVEPDLILVEFDAEVSCAGTVFTVQCIPDPQKSGEAGDRRPFLRIES